MNSKVDIFLLFQKELVSLQPINETIPHRGFRLIFRIHH